MSTAYTQFLARTERPTQLFGAFDYMDVYVLPFCAAGHFIFERNSESGDVRISRQVAWHIAAHLGRGRVVLSIAAEDGPGFWCALFGSGDSRPLFEHNRLVGPPGFCAPRPASLGDAARLAHFFGDAASGEKVHAALSKDYRSSLDQHGELARALRLPSWSVGLGYSRAAGGMVPAEAGAPRRPPSFLADLRPVPRFDVGTAGLDSKERFQLICQRAFSFLEHELGFRRDPWPSFYMVFYRKRDFTVIIEGGEYGVGIRLCLIDREGHLCDLSALVEARDPERYDLCARARMQREQIPAFADALRVCASDLLAGNLKGTRLDVGYRTGFSFSPFYSATEAEEFLARYGPRPCTALARVERST